MLHSNSGAERAIRGGSIVLAVLIALFVGYEMAIVHDQNILLTIAAMYAAGMASGGVIALFGQCMYDLSQGKSFK